MNTKTFFTLSEYKSNFERLKKEFMDAYIDNDEEEFIAIQTEWYQRCLENTILEYGIVADSVGWDTKAMITGEGFVKVVDNKVRNERGGVSKGQAENLRVSFKKIIKYLDLQKERIKPLMEIGGFTATQWALYYYFLQRSKVIPPFKEKVKEIKALSHDIEISPKNFQVKFNAIEFSRGMEGYSEKDVKAVILLLEKHQPTLIPEFEKLTLHIF